MIEIIQKDKALETLNGYFSMLQSTGYVKHSATKRYLLYTLLIDFVQNSLQYLEDGDYNIIRDALIKLFSTGCCLMPYSQVCRTCLKRADYKWETPQFRATEENEWFRLTEQENYRIVR